MKTARKTFAETLDKTSWDKLRKKLQSIYLKFQSAMYCEGVYYKSTNFNNVHFQLMTWPVNYFVYYAMKQFSKSGTAGF